MSATVPASQILQWHVAQYGTLTCELRTAAGERVRIELRDSYSQCRIDEIKADGSDGKRISSAARGDKQWALVMPVCINHSSPVLLGTLQVRGQSGSLSSEAQRDLVQSALVEWLALPVPDAAELAKQRKHLRAQQAAERKVKAAAKVAEQARAEKRRERDIVARTPTTAVTDMPSLLAALPIRLKDGQRLAKALQMLKKDGFQLFHEISDTAISGVVRSQFAEELVYACRMGANGDICCCTQNLNVCGGLRGEACKHLLVLLIGLAQAGLVNAQTVDSWLAAGLGRKPVLDRELMSDVFLRYSSAQAGELDWRPTETIPEDYYAY